MSKEQKFIYLDNNGTTRVCDEAAQLMADWVQSCSNISSSNHFGLAGRKLVDSACADVAKLCNLGNNYYILWTSGGSESNCTMIHMVVDAWHTRVGGRPHIVTSSIEHKSILECLGHLEVAKRVDVTYVAPDETGIIDPDDVDNAIRKNTALVTIMFANNELGSINQVRRIGEIAHAHKVPFHTDAVQIFGKVAINVPAFNIDALSMSFHKIYGPPGVGLLLLKKSFADGYKLHGVVAGTQQSGLRGGTENVPGIAGAAAALLQNFKRRSDKNARLARLRGLLLELLGRTLPFVNYSEFCNVDKSKKVPLYMMNKRGRALCVLGAKEKNCHLPNTVLLSVIDYDREFCNVKFKKLLETQGVIVSIGSACNTSSKSASHVLTAIGAPAIVKRGVLRISIGDYNTEADIRNFVRIFLDALTKM